MLTRTTCGCTAEPIALATCGCQDYIHVGTRLEGAVAKQRLRPQPGTRDFSSAQDVILRSGFEQNLQWRRLRRIKTANTEGRLLSNACQLNYPLYWERGSTRKSKTNHWHRVCSISYNASAIQESRPTTRRDSSPGARPRPPGTRTHGQTVSSARRDSFIWSKRADRAICHFHEAVCQRILSTLQGPNLNAQNSALGVGILGADTSFTITDIVLLLASVQDQPTQSASIAL